MNKRVTLPEPDISPVPGSSELYQLNHDFALDTESAGHVLLRRGLQSDGASIPRFAWVIVGHPFQPKVLAAALVHDGLCQSGLVPRPEADAAFYEIMRRYNVAAVKRSVFWASVRASGALGYPHYTPEIVTAARRLVSVGCVKVDTSAPISL